MTEKELIEYWASICKSEDSPTWHPKSGKDILNKPASETIRQLTGNLVVEMALPLQNFKKRVDGLRFQLIENWCLCRYCQLYDKTNENFKHWISEFKAFAKNLQDFEIKGKIDKRKTISKMLVDDYDYNQARKILFVIREKFNAEKLMDMSKRNTIATDFTNSIGARARVSSATAAWFAIACEGWLSGLQRGS